MSVHISQTTSPNFTYFLYTLSSVVGHSYSGDDVVHCVLLVLSVTWCVREQREDGDDGGVICLCVCLFTFR